MPFVGGMNQLFSGAVVGVGAISLLIEVLRQLEHGFVVGSITVAAPGGTQEIGLGVAMLLVLIFRRGGITGNQEIGGRPLSTVDAKSRPLDVFVAKRERCCLRSIRLRCLIGPKNLLGPEQRANEGRSE